MKFRFSITLRAAIAILLLANGYGRSFQLEFDHRFEGRKIQEGATNLTTANGTPLSIMRLEYLLSAFALQDETGEWISSKGWFGFISLTQNLTQVSIDLPPGTYKGIRFVIGVDPETNLSDPNRYGPRHALNPQLNGLHWGWQGGYVFLAIEGRYQKKDASLGGYSYHIANDPNLMMIELPVDLDASKHSSVSIQVDVDKIFAGDPPLDIENDGEATHSRNDDPLAVRLKKQVEKAFSINRTSSDRFQPIPVVSKEATPIHGTPYPINISARLPKVAFPEDNPLTIEGVALGKKLFFDNLLSSDASISCSTCHQPEHGFSDPRKFSKGVNGEIGVRQSMPLFNLAWHKDFFWDGRVKTIREQVLHPIEDPTEMAQSLPELIRKLSVSDDYPDRFEAAFGDPKITSDRIALSLEQYLLTLISQNSRFDRAARKELQLTDQERRGLQLFVTEHDPEKNLFGADCFHCHGGNLFTTHQHTNNGLDSLHEDKGRGTATKNEADIGKFKAPSLRNIARTAPYMHDGRFKTLMEVVNHYDHGIQASPTLDPNLAKHPEKGLGLTQEDKEALVAFLETLTDKAFLEAHAE